MHRVLIVQEYVPRYRVPFFEALRATAFEAGIQVDVAASRPGGHLASRADAASPDWILPFDNRELSLGGRRIVLGGATKLWAGYDLVVLEQARRNPDVYRLLLPRRKRGPRIALWGHGRDYTFDAGPLSARVMRLLTSRASWFFGYTSRGVEYVTERGFDPARTTVVQNSVDTSTLKNLSEAVSPAELRAFAERHDLRGKTALFLGGLDASKRLPFLLEAAVAAHARTPDFRLLIGGAGAQEQLVTDFTAGRHWARYLGRIDGAAKAVAMKSAQLLAMPGRVGLAIVDGFATGLPIVTTSWPWHAPEFEYLQQGVNGMVTEDTVPAYTEELVGLLGDPGRLAAMRKSCVEASGVYTVAAMAANFTRGLAAALYTSGPAVERGH